MSVCELDPRYGYRSVGSVIVLGGCLVGTEGFQLDRLESSETTVRTRWGAIFSWPDGAGTPNPLLTWGYRR